MTEIVTMIIIGLVISAASVALSELLRPKPDIENARPADLGDFNFPTSTEGRKKQKFHGTIQMPGPNVMWWGDLRPFPIKVKLKTGLFSSESQITGFRYFIGIQFGLGLGGSSGFGGVTRIWIGDTEVYNGPAVADGTININEPNLFGGLDKGQGGVVGTLRIVPGTLTQTQPTYLIPFQTPAVPYRGLAYALWEGGEVGTSPQIKPWKFEVQLLENQVGLTGNDQASIAFPNAGGSGYVEGDVLTLVGGTGTAATVIVDDVSTSGVVTRARVTPGSRGSYSSPPANPAATTGGTGAGATFDVTYFGPHVVNGLDSNPVEIIYDYLTDDDWGRGYPAADIDLSNFQLVGTTLHGEGNGWSFNLDRGRQGTDFLEEIERQIDGKVLFDMGTGKWVISLARGGYDVGLLPEVTDEGSEPTVLEVQKFDDGLWQNTVNQVRVKYTDRGRDYFETSATADDLANLRIQGERVQEEVRYPGCKDAALANKLCSRTLMLRSVPLKSATLIVERSFWNTKPVDVIAWTDSIRGIAQLPMRVQGVDLGELDRGQIKLQCVQDVFGFTSGIFGDPPRPRWRFPEEAVVAIPAAEQVVIEAPYAFIRRDPDLSLVLDRLWCGARAQTGNEISFKIFQRNDPVTPVGAYADSGEVFGFFLIGEVRTLLSATGSGPGAEVLEVDPTPDARLEIFNAFTQNPSTTDLGQNLINLVYVGGEWMAFPTVTDQLTYVRLANGYRALLDSTPVAHAVDDKAYMAFVNGGLSFDTIMQPNVVDVQLRAVSNTDEVAEVNATTVQLTMDNVARRAIIPVEPQLNALRYRDPVDVDDIQPGGSGLDASGVDLIYNRRDYRNLDETQSLVADAGSFIGDFPSFNSHENRTRIDEAGESLTTSEEAFWRFEEASGTRLDETANDVDLTDNATVTRNLTGKIGASAVFTAVNSEFLEAAMSTELDFGDVNWSFGGWLKLTSKVTGDVLSKWTEQSNQRSYRLYYDAAVDRMRLAVSGDGTAVTILTADRFGSPNVGEWIHFYVEHDATLNRIRTRFNFDQYDQAAHTGGTFAASTAKFRLGADVDGAGTNQFFLDGELDATGAWSRRLSETEQGLLYFSTVGQERPFAGRRTFFFSDWSATNNPFISRTLLLENAEGSLPVVDSDATINARHTFEGTVFESRKALLHTFGLDVSDLDALDSLGLVRSNIVSPVHAVDSTQTWNLEIGTAFDGTVDARLNGGAFSTVISAGATAGTLAVTSGDDLEVRHGLTSKTVTAGSFVVGLTYVIVTIGSTDFALIGAVNNLIGASFVATGVGTGTGTADFTSADRTLLLIKNGDGTPVDKSYATLIKQTTPVLENLGAHYKFNEASGAATDSHINGLGLTNTGAIGTKSDGKIGTARGLLTTANYFQRTAVLRGPWDIVGLNSVSFFAWIWLDSQTTVQTVCAIWSATTADQGFFFRYDQSLDDFVFAMGDGAGGSVGTRSMGPSVTEDAWVAVGFSYDHVTNTMLVYVKNPSMASASNTATGQVGGFQNTNRHQFSVGSASGVLLGLDGYIDSGSWWRGRVLQNAQFDWLAEGHDLDEFDQIP